MNFGALLSAFATIFVAELGDKTQLATFSLAAGGKSRLAIFIGASLALIATTLMGVLLGGAITRYVPVVWLRRIAGAIFIVLGVLYLLPERNGG